MDIFDWMIIRGKNEYFCPEQSLKAAHLQSGRKGSQNKAREATTPFLTS